jgi:hypothetical protein
MDTKAQIQCKMLHTTLGEYEQDSFDSFSALSYVWGVMTDLVMIQINDCEFPVTTNLYLALRDLWDSKRTRRMWIDSICIHQQDDNEKSIQVQQMWKVIRMRETP